jgi:hypothetical protein
MKVATRVLCMVATGRDIATFVFGLALAGLLPILALPNLDVMAVLAVAAETAGGFPLEQVGVVAFIAMLGAAWVDTKGRPDPDVAHWD